MVLKKNHINLNTEYFLSFDQNALLDKHAQDTVKKLE